MIGLPSTIDVGEAYTIVDMAYRAGRGSLPM